MKIFNRSRFYLYGISSLILIGIIIVMWPKKYNFATDEPFIVVTNYSAGPDDYRNMYDDTIAIHNDGRLVLYSTGNDDLIMGEDAPTLEIQLDGDQIEQVKETLTENLPYVYLQNISINMDGELVLYVESREGSDMEVSRDIPELNIQLTDNELEEVQELIKEHFWKLNERIINPDSRDRMESITVHLTEEEKTVRGKDPINTRFTAIRDFLVDLIDEKEYEAWTEEIVEELWEDNVLDSDKKTDYNMEEPFLTLKMERYLGGNSLRPYYQKISINTGGNITLYADENQFKNIDNDAPIMEVQANDAELEEIKKLIEKNFWALDERNYVPGGKEHMESITLKLTDDDMTVEGNDPDDRKFNAIRRAMINFFDKEVYEKWEKEAEKYISESGPDF